MVYTKCRSNGINNNQFVVVLFLTSWAIWEFHNELVYILLYVWVHEYYISWMEMVNFCSRNSDWLKWKSKCERYLFIRSFVDNRLLYQMQCLKITFSFIITEYIQAPYHHVPWAHKEGKKKNNLMREKQQNIVKFFLMHTYYNYYIQFILYKCVSDVYNRVWFTELE